METSLTPKVLRDMILKCLEDFELIMPYPQALPAEPSDELEDPPELLTETLGNIVTRLKKLKPEDQRAICNNLGFYEMNEIVAFIQRLQKAIKGK